MKRNYLRGITCAALLCTSVAIGGNSITANAATVTSNKIQVQTVKVHNFKELGEKIDKSITITKSNIIFDKNKAAKAGLTSEEINKLNSLYDEMNQMVKDGKASIFETSNGKYDIKMNQTNDPLMEQKSIISPHYYGIDFYFSAGECADAAAYLAGGSVSLAVLSGLLGLSGPAGVPAAAMTLVASGIAGLGSAYLWYCSNRNGLDATYNYATGLSFHRNNN
ncbi:hypothetical protein [Clostridium sp.]|uniref:hypothetical protein n=1 Tax=Clostridium sp. TaxID=1506 RepID=UPI00284F107E|nr:hypothetical protein [Clostridium sp.]MDR3598085.1 hypothetical protein [Clostridium sp.]